VDVRRAPLTCMNIAVGHPGAPDEGAWWAYRCGPVECGRSADAGHVDPAGCKLMSYVHGLHHATRPTSQRAGHEQERGGVIRALPDH
jgi:hypothetical protein